MGSNDISDPLFENELIRNGKKKSWNDFILNKSTWYVSTILAYVPLNEFSEHCVASTRHISSFLKAFVLYFPTGLIGVLIVQQNSTVLVYI